ncbi:EscN/YscN/HrcN family type III secretion system ATPase, partial [Arthrobacter deserti]|nr:EscN/YscN/HrcN family type III secretion system ATPase [Arthrobacter deserti]
PEHTRLAAGLRKVMAARRAAQDLLDVGAYQRGSNPLVDAAVDHADEINMFLQQRMDDQTPADQAWEHLRRLATNLGGI